ncbi:MAG: hypothetical protein R2864_08920 [Syntrophotaleaceae bacterium]
MLIHPEEILETINMVSHQHLDIRTVTMGISLRDLQPPRYRSVQQDICSGLLLR